MIQKEGFSPEEQSMVGMPRGIEGIQEILTPPGGALWLTDLDNTIKEGQKFQWPDGVKRRVVPQAVAGLLALHYAGITKGVMTEQAFTEIEPWLREVTSLALGNEHTDPYELFNGLSIGEGGNVVRYATGSQKGVIRVIAPSQARADRERILSSLEEHIQPAADEELKNDNWGVLRGAGPENGGTFVQLPGPGDQGIATISLWKKGPLITQDPKAASQYGVVDGRIGEIMREAGITTLSVYEAGNGTGRIVPKEVHKARTLGLLSTFSSTFTRTHMVYSCDGPNDEQAAAEIKLAGGGIIAVGNATDVLRAISDIKIDRPEGLGFGQAVSLIFPDQYQRAWEDMQRRGVI